MAKGTIDALTLIQGDFDRAVKPSLVESYSFEYAYRLFLVLCSSKPNAIKSLNPKEFDALEPSFLTGVKACIAVLNEDKGLTMDEGQQEEYASIAAKTLIRYLKGGMGPSPAALASQVAKALEDKLYQDGVLDPNIAVTKVFLESAR